MSEESWITPKFPVIANFKRSTGDFLFAERRLIKKVQPNTDRYVINNNALVYVYTILEPSMGKCCPIGNLAHSHHQSWGILSMLTCLQTTLKQHITKPTKTYQKSHANQLTSDKVCMEFFTCDLNSTTELCWHVLIIAHFQISQSIWNGIFVDIITMFTVIGQIWIMVRNTTMEIFCHSTQLNSIKLAEPYSLSLLCSLLQEHMSICTSKVLFLQPNRPIGNQITI